MPWVLAVATAEAENVPGKLHGRKGRGGDGPRRRLMTIAVIAGSVLLFLAGLWLIVRWGGMVIKPPGLLQCADSSGGPIFGALRP